MRSCFYSITFTKLFLTGILLSPCFSQKIDIEVKTESYYGGVAPRHAAVIWIQKPGDELVSTVEVWSYQYNFCMMNWRRVAGLDSLGEYDGITQATIPDHSEPIQVSWYCKDTAGNLVQNGTYEFCVEFAESEYYWKLYNPDEVYLGKHAKGTIELGDNPKVAYGDTSDTCFSNFTATYDPTTSIAFHVQKPVNNASLSYWYNPVMQKVAIQFNAMHNNSAVLHIINLKGEIIKTVEINTGSNEFYWDLRNRSGEKVSSGVYLFEVRSANTNKRISDAYVITLMR